MCQRRNGNFLIHKCAARVLESGRTETVLLEVDFMELGKKKIVNPSKFLESNSNSYLCIVLEVTEYSP